MTIRAEQLGSWYRAYGAELLLYARQLVDDQVAEDVVQEAFIQLFKQGACPDQVRAWLYRVVRNLALSWMRRVQRRCRLRIHYGGGQASWFETAPDLGLDAERAQRLLEGLPRD